MATEPAGMRVGFSFDGKNPSAQASVDSYVRRYTWNIAYTTRQAINALVRHSIAEGVTPTDTADLIKNIVGLTARQATAAMRYRQNLEKSGLAVDSVDKLMGEYTMRKRRERAWMIARTETMGAMNAGSLESYRQAKAEGLLTDDAIKEWIVTPDEKLCDICSGNAADKIAVDAAFTSGDIAPPAHPMCRCTIVVTEPLPGSGDKPQQKLPPAQAEFDTENWDSTKFEDNKALAKDLQRRLGVTEAECEAFAWNDYYCDDMGARGRFHFKQAVGDINFIGISTYGTSLVTATRNPNLAGTAQTVKKIKWESTQTLLHEFSHAQSPVIKALGYQGRNISLEEGIVELRGRELADRLWGTNWKNDGLGWAYTSYVAGVERILAKTGKSTEEFFRMDAAQRIAITRQAGLQHIEDVAKRINPELGKNIKQWIESDTNRAFLDGFGQDVMMDPTLWNRTQQSFSVRGFRNWLRNIGMQSENLDKFVRDHGGD